MSDEDTDGTGSERPMLILGDDLPDVEDTTPEQLRREREQAGREIERRRREAQEEIERRRREAEREIAELEARRERELEQRQQELERTQRELAERESTLRADPAGGAPPTGRLVPSPLTVPLTERGLRRSRRAWLAGGLAALCLLVTTLTVPGPPSDARLAQLEGIDEARVLWLTSAAVATEALTLRIAGEEPPAGLVAEHLTLAGQAAATTPDTGDYHLRVAARSLEKAREQSAQIFAEGTSDVRALALWDQLHLDLGYAVSQGEVRQVRDDLLPGRGWAVTTSVLAALALTALAALATLAKDRRAVLLSGAAAVLAVSTLLVVSAAGSGGALEEAEEAHDRANLFLATIHSTIHDDLAEAYGTSSASTRPGPGHFAADPYRLTDQGADVDAYLAARTELGRATTGDEEALPGAAVALAAEGRALLEDQFAVVGAARADLLAELRAVGPGRGVTALLTGAAALLAATAVLASRGRAETRDR